MISRNIARFHRRREIFRKYLFAALGRVTPRLAVDGGSLRYYVSTTDLLGRQIFMTGHFEMDLFAGALSSLRAADGTSIEGKTIVDIGANIGTTVIPAVKLFGAGRAIAFEPEPTNLKLLKQNLIENEVEDRVQVVPVALSDVNSEGTLELGGSNWGDHRVRMGASPAGGQFDEDRRVTTPVALRRFDDVSAELGLDLGEVGLVWMDVQGHEGHVLSGAGSLLGSTVPLVTEYWPYGLRRAGGLDSFHELVAAHYCDVVDLRASARAGREMRVRLEDLDGLEAQYAEDFTDLLLLS